MKKFAILAMMWCGAVAASDYPRVDERRPTVKDESAKPVVQ
jgi:hypothetical protein